MHVRELPQLRRLGGEVTCFPQVCEPVGLAQIAKGQKLKELATPAYFTNKTGYVDRDLTLAPGPFLAAVDKAVQDLHASGKLKELSMKFFDHDYASQAATFDLATLDQSGS